MFSTPTAVHSRAARRTKPEMAARQRRKVTILGAALAGAAALTLMQAPTASAVGSSACTVNTTDRDAYVSANAVNYRSGPGTSYSSKGLLYRGDQLRTLCTTVKSGSSWYYTKLRQRSKSGLPAGTYGWVRADMFRF